MAEEKKKKFGFSEYFFISSVFIVIFSSFAIYVHQKWRGGLNSNNQNIVNSINKDAHSVNRSTTNDTIFIDRKTNLISDVPRFLGMAKYSRKFGLSKLEIHAILPNTLEEFGYFAWLYGAELNEYKYLGALFRDVFGNYSLETDLSDFDLSYDQIIVVLSSQKEKMKVHTVVLKGSLKDLIETGD